MTGRGLVAAKGVVAEAVDRIYGIETNTQVSQAELGYETGSPNLPYQPSSWLSVPGVFSGWTPAPGRQDVLVDLGCGKGRALVQIARRFRLARIVGLEHSPAMADCARRNLERTRVRHRTAAVEVLNGDASRWKLPDDVTIVYLANPFIGEVFAAALERIIESHDRRPRGLRVAYVHPVEHERVLATGRFRELPRGRPLWMALTGVDPEEFRRYEVIGRAD